MIGGTHPSELLNNALGRLNSSRYSKFTLLNNTTWNIIHKPGEIQIINFTGCSFEEFDSTTSDIKKMSNSEESENSSENSSPYSEGNIILPYETSHANFHSNN